MMKLVNIILGICVVLGTIGCNTMQGLGKDIEKVGGKIESKANEKK
jgi:predicted small secreted protein